MAKQKGIVKLKGTIGDLSFYKTRDGYLAREKTTIDRNRIATDPAFQRTRENGQEFGRGGKAGKIMRHALRQLLQISSDSRVTSRLTREMIKVVKSDPESKRGDRIISKGDLNILMGFEFNNSSRLSSTLYVPYEVIYDRATGAASIALNQFVSAQDIAYPLGSSHIKMHLGIAEIDFETEEHLFKKTSSESIQISPDETAAFTMEEVITENSEKDVFIVLGVEFQQEVNGMMYSLKNGAFNALAIVGVSRV